MYTCIHVCTICIYIDMYASIYIITYVEYMSVLAAKEITHLVLPQLRFIVYVLFEQNVHSRVIYNTLLDVHALGNLITFTYVHMHIFIYG